MKGNKDSTQPKDRTERHDLPVPALPSDLTAEHTRGQAALPPAALTSDASTLTRGGAGRAASDSVITKAQLP